MEQVPQTTVVPWADGLWTRKPLAINGDGEHLLVTAEEGSDAWRHTSYGFVHDNPHALLTPIGSQTAVEVSFVLDYDQQFDQAGIYLSVSDEHWIKAGVEYCDGFPQLGAVVTNGKSDWSVARVPEWFGRTVTIRASRAGDAVTFRARADDEPFRLVRLVPLEPDLAVHAGPMTCAPTRAGLTVRFTRWAVGAPDAELH